MIKKYLLLVVLTVMTATTMVASTWKIHNYYVTSMIQNVIDTDNKVYYLNSGQLFQYDKTTQVTTALNRHNLLSDDHIKQIYYDYETKLLFIAYDNCNIDIIDADNNKYNINNLRTHLAKLHGYTLDEKCQLSSNIDKIINDITFTNGIAYVATGSGYLAIDEATRSITKIQALGNTVTVNSVAVLEGGDMLILSNANCYYGPADAADPIKTFKKYPVSTLEGKMYPIDDHSVFILGPTALYNFDLTGSTPTLKSLVSAKPTCVQKSPNGYIANFEGKKYYYTIDVTGKTATKASSVLGFASCNPSGNGTVWISDANGLHVENSTDYHKVNALTTDRPYWLKYNSAMDLLYAGVSARNDNTVTSTDALPDNVINTFNGVEWADATAYTASGAGYEFVFNPLDSTTYVRASWVNGIHKVTNNVLKSNYTKNNSTVGHYKSHPAFDKYGNLWAVRSLAHRSDTLPDGSLLPPVSVLTKDKLSKTNTTKSDWFQPRGLWGLNTGNMQRSRFIISKVNNVKFYSDCDFLDADFVGRIICWDNNNEDPKVDNYWIKGLSHFTDQFNKRITWVNLSHMEEDAEGYIWVGHLVGVFFFDPNTVYDVNPRAIRPTVTTASIEDDLGYLCEGYTVNDIGVDRDNNKWIATNNGLYFVSPDGSTIYEHFTTTNSDIPSNQVHSVECDTKHDRVYIYTAEGFAEYAQEDDAAALDFSNVYTHPNPVSPDFTGMIKIGNLMSDTHVTITNRDGVIVKQLGPVTGQALWDGCGADGERVPTGIYNIYATQGSTALPTGKPLTTVLIIK